MNRAMVQKLMHDLGYRADAHRLETLNAHQRVALLAWSTIGIIYNGGFRYFYEGTIDMREAVQAFRTLGLDKAADACLESLSMFPGGHQPTTENERWELVRSRDWRTLAEAEARLFELGWDAITDAIGAYVARHPEEFEFRFD